MFNHALPFSQEYFVDLDGAESIITYSNEIKDESSLNRLESNLRELEVKIPTQNIYLLKHFASIEGAKWVENPDRVIEIKTKQQACTIRYLLMPMLYKLGLTAQASSYGEKTFKFLFPFIHKTLSKRVNELFYNALNHHLTEIVERFSFLSEYIESSYHRIKSIHSIWRKLPSTTELLTMNHHDFAMIIDDYIAFRWDMKVIPDENRYDALMNGVRMIPDGWHYFRNQQLPQAEGFDCEPVMKFYYIINTLPIEIQILGGPQIECYMCAKGYSNYKSGMRFLPNKEDLTDEQWESRLGMCIEYAESGRLRDFRELMLSELAGESVIYASDRRFVLDAKPMSEANVNYIFDGSNIPVYNMENYGDGILINVKQPQLGK